MHHRRLICFALTLFGGLAVTPSALAAVPVTVQPGDTLWSLAARNNLTTRTVAAYNGVSEGGTLQVGQTVSVPTVDEGAVALQGQGVAPAAETAAAPAQTAAAPSAPSGGGGYTVQPGDTLSALAANAGVSVSELAAMNGLDPDGLLLAGTSLSVSGGSPAPAQASEPAAPQETAAPAPAAASAPTGQTVGASDIQSVAAQHGVSPSLAAAIAWQESGFNNAAVSSANARGVMQVMPGTWDDVQSNLASRPLDPNSAGDNVEAGVLYLKQLLQDTGGDENTAIAGYYQGLGSVRSRGNYEDTDQYVANVQALRSRFGG